MKIKLLTFLVLILTFGLASFVSASPVHASDIVGHESHTINWRAYGGADWYQVYFNQVGSSQVVTVSDLTRDSRELTLNLLKPCTTYNFSVKAFWGQIGSWVIQSRSFTTGGTNCRPTWVGGTVPMQAVKGATTTLPFIHSRAYNQNQYNAYMGEGQNVGGAPLAMNYQPTQTPQVLSSMSGQMGRMSCNYGTTGRVSWTSPVSTVANFNVYYGTKAGNWQHAVRDLTPNARELTIGSLNSCSPYYYSVQAVDTAGHSYWLASGKMSTWK
jgi:hypothetical protein